MFCGGGRDQGLGGTAKQTDIALDIAVSPGTVSRELMRNKGKRKPAQRNTYVA